MTASSEVSYDLGARSTEYRDLLEFLLEQHDVSRRWDGSVLKVSESSRTEVDEAIAYLDAENVPPGPRTRGQGVPTTGPQPLIVTREEARLCLFRVGCIVSAYCLMFALFLVDRSAPSIVFLLPALLLFVSGVIMNVRFHRLRYDRAPDVFPSPSAQFWRVVPTYDRTRPFASARDAIAYLRHERGANRVGPRGAPPPG